MSQRNISLYLQATRENAHGAIELILDRYMTNHTVVANVELLRGAEESWRQSVLSEEQEDSENEMMDAGAIGTLVDRLAAVV